MFQLSFLQCSPSYPFLQCFPIVFFAVLPNCPFCIASQLSFLQCLAIVFFAVFPNFSFCSVSLSLFFAMFPNCPFLQCFPVVLFCSIFQCPCFAMFLNWFVSLDAFPAVVLSTGDSCVRLDTWNWGFTAQLPTCSYSQLLWLLLSPSWVSAEQLR